MSCTRECCAIDGSGNQPITVRAIKPAKSTSLFWEWAHNTNCGISAELQLWVLVCVVVCVCGLLHVANLRLRRALLSAAHSQPPCPASTPPHASSTPALTGRTCCSCSASNSLPYPLCTLSHPAATTRVRGAVCVRCWPTSRRPPRPWSGCWRRRPTSSHVSFPSPPPSGTAAAAARAVVVAAPAAVLLPLLLLLLQLCGCVAVLVQRLLWLYAVVALRACWLWNRCDPGCATEVCSRMSCAASGCEPHPFICSTFACLPSSRRQSMHHASCNSATPGSNALACVLCGLRRAHPRSVHLTVAVVQWVTPYKRRKQGLCSTYLASLQPSHTHTHTSNSNNMNISNGNYTNASSSGPHQQQDQGPRVAVWVERGALRLPASPQAPLLLVGPGTGVAPFRAFLQERAVQLAAAAAQADRTPATEDNTAAGSGEPAALPGPAPCSLFFGCRSRAADFYYAEEWEGRQAAGVLAPGPEGFVAAFSRDQPSKVRLTTGEEAQAGGDRLGMAAHLWYAPWAWSVPPDEPATSQTNRLWLLLLVNA